MRACPKSASKLAVFSRRRSRRVARALPDERLRGPRPRAISDLIAERSSKRPRRRRRGRTPTASSPSAGTSSILREGRLVSCPRGDVMARGRHVLRGDHGKASPTSGTTERLTDEQSVVLNRIGLPVMIRRGPAAAARACARARGERYPPAVAVRLRGRRLFRLRPLYGREVRRGIRVTSRPDPRGLAATPSLFDRDADPAPPPKLSGSAGEPPQARSCAADGSGRRRGRR